MLGGELGRRSLRFVDLPPSLLGVKACIRLAPAALVKCFHAHSVSSSRKQNTPAKIIQTARWPASVHIKQRSVI